VNPASSGGVFRKVVNREGGLGSCRLALMRVVDPIEWYVRKHGNNFLPLPKRSGPNASSP
jgi:hypothetical protein